MPKSKHRKGFKQRSQNFKNKIVQEKNRNNRLQREFIENFKEQIEISRREYNVEQLLEKKPELFVETNGIKELDVEKISENKGVLVDGNNVPLMAEIEESDVKYPLYTKAFINAAIITSNEKKEARRKFEEEKKQKEDAPLIEDAEIIEEASK